MALVYTEKDIWKFCSMLMSNLKDIRYQKYFNILNFIHKEGGIDSLNLLLHIDRFIKEKNNPMNFSQPDSNIKSTKIPDITDDEQIEPIKSIYSENDICYFYSTLISNIEDIRYQKYVNLLNFIHEEGGIDSLNLLLHIDRFIKEKNNPMNFSQPDSNILVNPIFDSKNSSQLDSNIKSMKIPDIANDKQIKTSKPKDFIEKNNILQVFDIFQNVPNPHKIETYIDMCKLFINKNNLISFWNFIFDFDNETLCDLCYDCLHNNFEFIISNPDLLCNLKYIIVLYVTNSEKKILSEINLFKLVHKWITIKTHSLNEEKSLIDNIRFGLISPGDLINIIKPSGCINIDTYIKFLEYNYDKSKGNVSEKMYRERSINFYICSNKNVYPGYRLVTLKDFRSDEFQKKIINFINTHNGLFSCADFYPKAPDTFVNIGCSVFRINNEDASISHINFYKKNTMCPINNWGINERGLNKVFNVSIGHKRRSNISIYVKDF